MPARMEEPSSAAPRCLTSGLLLAGALALAACPNQHPTEGPGTLLDGRALDAGVNVPTTVPFDVRLFCNAYGPMQDLTSATGDLLQPDGGHRVLHPTWTTADEFGVDCTQDEWQRASHVHVDFVPDAPGTWHAQVTLEPKVGTFGRDVLVQ